MSDLELYQPPPEVIVPDEIIPPDGRYTVRAEQTPQEQRMEAYMEEEMRWIKHVMFPFHYTRRNPFTNASNT
jgi:hypothetical protein